MANKAMQMGAVGERDAVLCFKAIGMKVIPTTSPEETTRALFDLTQEGVRVIFITETAALEAPEALQRYKMQNDVAIIPVPGSQGSTGYAMARVKSNVEKAIGADILFNNQNKKEG
ncbi:MAG: V-type ATP synthase subunit F [Clostridiales bacterium]|nr:V-type ATP synthase subunit F [Clostridiales bacterium]